MASIITRSVTEHSILGQPATFRRNQLPTSADVFRAYDYYVKTGTANTVHERATLVAHEVKEMYDLASIGTIEVSSVVIRIKRLVSKVQDLGKYSDAKKSSSKYQENLHSLETLFDICACKCFDSGVRERSACKCPLASKIPAIEWEFWIDQKTTRNMVIGNIDKEETVKLQKKEKRTSKTRRLCFVDKKLKCDAEVSLSESEISVDVNSITDEEHVGDEVSSDEEIQVRNVKQYPELCKAVDRCKISNRDACLIANAVMKDLSLLTAETAIDPAKLRRQRNLWREKEVEKQAVDIQELICIGFDGKQDVTLAHTSGVRRRMKEEHYAIISYPEERYVDHVMPESSKANDIAKEILSAITETNSVQTLAAVVCDGTVNNTGKKGGVIRRLEEGVGRPLQWFVCLLHANELPLRKYMSVVEGGCTTGPSSSSGEISMALQFDPKDLPILNFKAIDGKVNDVSDNVKTDLSTDQIYLLKACLAVQQGYTASEHISFLQTAMPGNLNHARWLTKANRILRLYMSQQNCSQQMYRITRFILNVYAPSWFNIKHHSSCLDGARNFFYLMKRCYELGPEDWEILEPVLQNNCYFAHPENIILAGVTDEDECIRKFAREKLIEARIHSPSTGIRVFDKSTVTLNSSASSYIDMIDWTASVVTPPPLLSNTSNDSLEQLQADSFKGIPCHSQAVERCIKDISATTMKVFGHKARHGMVMQCKKSRAELPKVDSKSDFL
jgi:hypothetical protein